NKDTIACSASSFTLEASVPGGWTSALDNASLSLAPGATGTTTLRVTSPVSASAGSYSVGVTAPNSGNPASTASASAQYVVAGAINSFSDDFNRADNTTLGNGWQEVAGDLKISANRLTNGLAGDNMAVLPALLATQQTAAADFASANNNAAPRFGIILGYSDPQNHYVLYRRTRGAAPPYHFHNIN